MAKSSLSMARAQVKPEVPLGEEVVVLSTLDQQAQRAYANTILAFELAQSTRNEKAIEDLKHGLQVALSEVPDFASSVVPLPGSTRNELELRLGPESSVPFEVLDHTTSTSKAQHAIHPLAGLEYVKLAKKSFPLNELLEMDLFIPVPDCESMCSVGLPAFMARIHLLKGGLLMALSWHHTVSDARGFFTFLSSWARHTAVLASKASQMNTVHRPPAEESLERWKLSPAFPALETKPLSNYSINPGKRPSAYPNAPHLLDWQDPVARTATMSTWYFSSNALKSLRSLTSEVRSDDGSHFTQSEAVSALIWKHLSRARKLDSSYQGGSSLFAARVDYRGRTQPPFHEEFIGNINEPNAHVRLSLNDVCTPSTPKSLATLAQAISAAILSTGEKQMRDFIGITDALDQVTDLTWDYDAYPGPDLVVTDMSLMDALRQDWGDNLGLPACIRSGSQEQGVAYYMPQDKDGGFEVQLQCEEEALERLKQDGLFSDFAVFQS